MLRYIARTLHVLLILTGGGVMGFVLALNLVSHALKSHCQFIPLDATPAYVAERGATGPQPPPPPQLGWWVCDWSAMGSPGEEQRHVAP